MTEAVLTKSGLKHFWDRIKNYFSVKSKDETISGHKTFTGGIQIDEYYLQMYSNDTNLGDALDDLWAAIPSEIEIIDLT